MPEAFGTMALVLTITALFDSFSQVGIKEAVIQDENSDETRYLNGAWFFACVRGLGLFALGILAAPYIAAFYNRPDLVPLLRVAFSTLLFRGLISVRSYIGLKRFDFKRWILVEQLGGVVGILSAIGLTFVWRSVWALVIGYTLEGMFRVILSFIIFPFKPQWEFDRTYLRSLFVFARRLFGTPILTYVFMRLDVFVVAKLMTDRDVGLYAMAASLAHIPDLLMSKFAVPVMTPAYALLQHDNQAINSSFVKTLRILCVIGCPIVAVALLHGEFIMAIIYSEVYAVVGLVFGLLAFASLVRNLGVPFASICMATGKPHVLRWSSAVRASIIAGGIYPATRIFGLEGAAACVVLAVLVFLVVQIMVMRRMTEIRLRVVLGPLALGLISTLPVLVIALFAGSSATSPARAIIVMVLSVIISYVFGGMLWWGVVTRRTTRDSSR